MPGIAAVWRDAWATFVAHAPSMLVLSVFGFAGASLLGLAVSQVLNVEGYVHASGPFATLEGIHHINIVAPNDARLVIVLVLQAMLGWVLTSFARGTVTHLALNGGAFGQACLCAFRRLPALLVGTLEISVPSGTSPIMFTWEFGDGTPTQAGASLSHTYATVDIFTAMVTAANSLGSTSASAQVSVAAAPSPRRLIYLPVVMR